MRNLGKESAAREDAPGGKQNALETPLNSGICSKSEVSLSSVGVLAGHEIPIFGKRANRSLGRSKISKPRKQTVKSTADWLTEAIRDESQRIIPNVANCLLALRRAPEIADCFVYDEMERSPFIVAQLPYAGGRKSNQPFHRRRLTDHDITFLQEWLQIQGLPRVGSVTVRDAVHARAVENSVHPVREYLDSLVWDGVRRVDGWLNYFMGTPVDRYSVAVGEMFLISMVARIYEPGCKADYTVILEGEQGIQKSAACSILGGKWFSDCLPDMTQGKEAAQHLRGKWLIEISEMAAMSKAEAAQLKSFMTRRHEIYRPPYGKEEISEPRQGVFIATTNDSFYLKDPTGNRRFWPIKVTHVRLDELERDRDQLFAEAISLYRKGKHWWPDAEFEATFIKPQQEARREEDAWESIIVDYLARERLGKVLISEIAISAIGMSGVNKINRESQNRIVAILMRLGYRRSDKKINGHYPYLPPSIEGCRESHPLIEGAGGAISFDA